MKHILSQDFYRRADYTDYRYHFSQLHSIKHQMDLQKKVMSANPYYFVLAMPTKYIKYNQNKNEYERFRYVRYAGEPYGFSPSGTPCYMNFTVFKIVSFTPAKLRSRFLYGDEVIATYPSVIFETLDGKRFEAFEPIFKHTHRLALGKNPYVFTSDVYDEMAKNFVHPRLNLSNCTQFSATARDTYDEEYKVIFSWISQDEIPHEYGWWKESIRAQYWFFEDYFGSQDSHAAEEAKKAQEAKMRNNRYENSFYKDFGR